MHCPVPPFADAEYRDYALFTSGADHHSVDLIAILDNNEIGDDRGPAVGEVDGESPSAVRINRVSALRLRMREVGSLDAADGDGVDLDQAAKAIEFGHGDSQLLTHWTEATQLGALHGESVDPRDQLLIACRPEVCAYPGNATPTKTRTSKTFFIDPPSFGVMFVRCDVRASQYR